MAKKEESVIREVSVNEGLRWMIKNMPKLAREILSGRFRKERRHRRKEKK